ncbi:hypothetical protein ES703_68508 [subsurface metagenome]
MMMLWIPSWGNTLVSKFTGRLMGCPGVNEGRHDPILKSWPAGFSSWRPIFTGSDGRLGNACRAGGTMVGIFTLPCQSSPISSSVGRLTLGVANISAVGSVGTSGGTTGGNGGTTGGNGGAIASIIDKNPIGNSTIWLPIWSKTRSKIV